MLLLTLSDFRTYIYVQNPKTVATPVRKYTYPDGNQNMGASNGHFPVSGPLHHELCTHGSHMYSKASNVLEYNYAVRVPSNVLEWYPMFSMFSKTKIMKKPILFVIFVSIW